MSYTDDELNTYQDALAQKYITPQQVPQDARDAIVNRYSTQELKAADPPESLLSKAGSYAGAFNAGFQNTWNKVVYDTNSTLTSMAGFIGLLSDKEVADKNKFYKDIMDTALKSQSGPGGSYSTDVAKHPTLANTTQTITSIGAELWGLGKLGGLVKGAEAATTSGRLAQALSADAIQGGAVSALQSDTNKGEAALQGGLLSGIAGAPFRLAEELSKGALYAGRTAGATSNYVAASNKLEDEANFRMTLSQRTGMDTTNPQKEAVMSNVDPLLSRFGTSLEQASNTTAKAAKANTMTQLTRMKDHHEATASQMYDEWKDIANPRVMTEPTLGKQAADDIISQLGKGDYSVVPSEGIVGKTAEDISNLNRLSPEQLLDQRRQVDKSLRTLFKQQASATSPEIEQSIDAMKSLRNGLENDLQGAAMASGTSQLYDKARNYFINNVLPIRQIKLNEDLGMNQVNKFKSLLSDPSRQELAQQALKAAGPNIEKAVKIDLMTDSLQSALSAGELNIPKFANDVNKNMKNYGLLFTEEDKQIANTFARMANVTAKNLKNNPTATPGLIEKSLVGGLKYMANTPIGQNLLLRAAKLPATDPKMQSLVDGIYSIGNGIIKGTASQLASQDIGNQK